MLFVQNINSIESRNPDVTGMVAGRGGNNYSLYWVPYLNLNIPVSVFLLNAQAGYSTCLFGPDNGVSVPFYGTVGVGVQLGKAQWSKLGRKRSKPQQEMAPPAASSPGIQ